MPAFVLVEILLLMSHFTLLPALVSPHFVRLLLLNGFLAGFLSGYLSYF